MFRLMRWTIDLLVWVVCEPVHRSRPVTKVLDIEAIDGGSSAFMLRVATEMRIGGD
jgi:hypothetical protein